jgi:hypothetical protein
VRRDNGSDSNLEVTWCVGSRLLVVSGRYLLGLEELLVCNGCGTWNQALDAYRKAASLGRFHGPSSFWRNQASSI